jgi:signal transduction histidine kinase
MSAGGDLKIRLRSQFPIELQRRCAERCYGRNYWIISIEDTGCGISPKVQKRMFEPFYASPLRHGRKGLGLAAVDGILSSHKGFIQVQSMPGEGTSIHVCLPSNA